MEYYVSLEPQETADFIHTTMALIFNIHVIIYDIETILAFGNAYTGHSTFSENLFDHVRQRFCQEKFLAKSTLFKTTEICFIINGYLELVCTCGFPLTTVKRLICSFARRGE